MASRGTGPGGWKEDDMTGGGHGDDSFFDPFAISETDEDKDIGYVRYDVPSTTPSSAASWGGGRASASATSPSPTPSGRFGLGLGGLFGASRPTSPPAARSSTVTTVDDGVAPTESDAAPITSTAPVDVTAAALAGNLAIASYAQKRTPMGEREKQYLQVERRGLWGQSAYNIGYTYFGGLVLGGMYGLVRGVMTAPNRHPRILLNSVLNGSGKYGAKTGNAGGVLAMVYTLVERQLEDVGVDTIPRTLRYHTGIDLSFIMRNDAALPAIAAFATGMLFTLPRAITMKGLDRHYVNPAKRLAVMVAGGGVTVAGVAVLSVLGPFVFGHRSPYRFSNLG